MKFSEFINSEQRKILDFPELPKHSIPFVSLATDLNNTIIWLSGPFIKWTNHSIENLKSKPLSYLFNKVLAADSKTTHVKMKIVRDPLPDLLLSVEATSVREDMNAAFQKYATYDDFILYLIGLFPISSIRRYSVYSTDMYATVDDNMNLVDTNDLMHQRLSLIAGSYEIRGSNLLEYLNKQDYTDWLEANRQFDQVANLLLEEKPDNWQIVFDSRTSPILPCTTDRIRGWTVRKNSVSFDQPPVESYGFLLLNLECDFFTYDYKVEAVFENSNGGIVMCGSEQFDMSPDERGYLAYNSSLRGRQEICIKRNSQSARILSSAPALPRFAMEKRGPCIIVSTDKNRLLVHKDTVPFHEQKSLTRIGLFGASHETIRDIKIWRRQSRFDYATLHESRHLVRFRNDPDRYYELTLFTDDYWGKPMTVACFKNIAEVLKMEKTLEEYRERLREAELKLQSGKNVFHGIIGKSPAFQELVSTVRTIASTRASVLITGETGVGKDLVALAIHNEGSPEKPFVKVDCAALPYNLIESELFGHEKGAFTGAFAQQKGKFEAADTGTIFLDEIGNLSVEVQAKLLRFLNDHAFERLGSTRTLHADVRIIAATNADLQRMVNEGKFRADLFYRLKVITIQIPPLRERREDIYPLFESLLQSTCARNNKPLPLVHNDVFPFLMHYEWPGNVRELKNVIEQTVLMGRGSEIALKDFPASVKEKSGKDQATKTGAYRDKEIFRQAFRQNKRKVSLIARHFGISPFTVIHYIKKYRLADEESSIEEILVNTLKQGKQTIKQLMAILGISFPTLKKLLKTAANKYHIEKTRESKTIYYYLKGD